MKNSIFVLLLTALALTHAHAQISSCALPSEPVLYPAPASDAPRCFDVEEIYQEKIIVYLRLNFHYFLDGNCQGKVQRVDQDVMSALVQLSDSMATYHNIMAARNPEQWPRQEPANLVFNPFRYVVKGVYFHCLDKASLHNMNQLHSQYGINPESEINVYLADFPGNHSGLANGYGGTFMGIENPFTGDFNHEIGHVLTLEHVNGNYNGYDDGCPDTNPALHSWDVNCDGQLSGNENFRLCWDYMGNPGNKTDGNKNGTPDCQEKTPCTPSPCCDWKYQNNNAMLSAGAYQETFTACQVKRMLDHASQKKCSYIEQIGGPPPPSAFITQNPADLLRTDRCNECLLLGASQNETAYSVQLIRESDEAPVYDSGWKKEKATQLCYTTETTGNASDKVRLAPNTRYRAILTVRNTAQFEDSFTYTFVTAPEMDCQPD